MTPPKVHGAAKPASSVMMSSTLGAPFGGTTRGAHHGVRLRGLLLDHPAEFRIGRRELLAASMVVVLPGAPETPVNCCANVDPATKCEKTRACEHDGTDFHERDLPVAS